MSHSRRAPGYVCGYVGKGLLRLSKQGWGYTLSYIGRHSRQDLGRESAIFCMNAHVAIASDSPEVPLNCVAFNQDCGCFSIGHDDGFRVYASDPLELRVQRDFSDGGIGTAEMLHRTNYLGLVGGGRTPKFPQNKVVIWDDSKMKVAVTLEFLSPVLNILLSRTNIVAILKNKVHLYAFTSPPTRLATYDTHDNPYGVGDLANNILAIPGPTLGRVQIINLGGTAAVGKSSSLSSPTASDKTNHDTIIAQQSHQQHLNVSLVKAHKAAIRNLALDPSGSFLATASDTGTIIRIYSTANTALLHEVRRGIDKATIYSMRFSPSKSRLAVLSDKSTLHVFNIATTTSSASGLMTNKKHLLGKVPLLPKYFASEWSFVSCHLSSPRRNTHGDHPFSAGRGVVGWPSEESIIVVWLKESRWEKYVIVEKELGPKSATQGKMGSPEIGFELVREAWRGFAGLSYD